MKPPEKPQIAILIPTRGDILQLKRCLNSIRSQHDIFIEVVIGLNNCMTRMERTKAEIQSLLQPGDQLLVCDSLNHARNQVFEKASADVIYFMDDDCELPQPGFLASLLQFLNGNTHLSGVGGPYRAPDSANVFERVYNKNSASWLESSRILGFRSLFLLGGNFATRKAVESRFDEGVAWGGAELGFFIEAARLGNLYECRVDYWVWHHCQLGLFSYIRKLRRQSIRTREYLMRGWLPRFEREVPVRPEGLAEDLALKLIRWIFLPDKLSWLVMGVFRPLRWIPRARVNAVYDAMMGYLILLNHRLKNR